MMKDFKYLVAIEEKQAWLIFNEVAKAEAADNLCLPVIFSMSVVKDREK